MAQAVQDARPDDQGRASGLRLGAVLRLLRYIVFRLIALAFTAMVGVYITILIANGGGFVDQIRQAEIRQEINSQALNDPGLQGLSASERRNAIEDRIARAFERQGLNDPFSPISFTPEAPFIRITPNSRSLDYLVDGITLSLGRSENIFSDSGSDQVRLILLERLPATLLLTGTSFFLTFFAALFIALFLSRRYGSWLDRAVIALAPTSAAPSWFYGLFLILIFSSIFRVLPFGGIVDAPVPESTWAYALSVLKHLISPMIATVMSVIFINIYIYRTYFLIFASEDYVEMAKAKGLSSRAIERRYVLRPTLPFIVTNFLLAIITLWTGSIILETVYNWPGLGRLLFQAIGQFDIAVIVGNVVIYAYLLGITVFLLDVIYGFLDPRVRVSGGKGGGSS